MFICCRRALKACLPLHPICLLRAVIDLQNGRAAQEPTRKYAQQIWPLAENCCLHLSQLLQLFSGCFLTCSSHSHSSSAGCAISPSSTLLLLLLQLFSRSLLYTFLLLLQSCKFLARFCMSNFAMFMDSRIVGHTNKSQATCWTTAAFYATRLVLSAKPMYLLTQDALLPAG